MITKQKLTNIVSVVAASAIAIFGVLGFTGVVETIGNVEAIVITIVAAIGSAFGIWHYFTDNEKK